MFIDNAKISTKIVGVIAQLAVMMVVSVAFASFGMRHVSSVYADLTERVEPAQALNMRRTRYLSEFAHRAYELAMEENEEGDQVVLKEIQSAQEGVAELGRQVRQLLPEHEAEWIEIDELVGVAYKACAGPIKAATDATKPEVIVQAGHRLRDECDPPLTRAIDVITKTNDRLLAATTAKSGELSSLASTTLWLTVGIALVGLLLSLWVGLWVASKGIARPIQMLSSVMERFARNDLDGDIPGTSRGDEVGAMARTVQVFKQYALERAALEADERLRIAAREARAQSIASLTQAFDLKAADLLEAIAQAAGQLKVTAQDMSATADQTSRQALEVSSAADQASSNVQTVATAAEELAASIHEIGRQVDQSNGAAIAAAAEAEQADRTVQGLAESSTRIGEVVSLINDIASQTNLLALNATIEAARAGNAGKGFAVVAGEVKQLASQTARATDEISQQIASVQTATAQAVTAIGGIVKRIGDINKIAATISSAVEEQSAATREIARNIQQAAVGTDRVSVNIGGVNQAAGETQTASGQVLDASQSLISQSAHLENEVSKFLSGVRAA